MSDNASQNANQDDDVIKEIRQAVVALCSRFPGEYWRQKDRDREYPTEFVQALTDAGYLAVLVPEEYGGSGLGVRAASAVLEEIHKSGCNGGACHAQMYIMGTLLRHGNEAQKQKYLPGIASGDLRLQAFGVTEPTSGTDTLSLRTTAVKQGNDRYIINGQKVWTSGGRSADYALLITRTDLDQPKHTGITFFFLPMKQAGVEVRPLRQATGDARFNEVFITDARVPHENMLGEYNRGWWVLQTALAYERAAMGQSGRRRQTQKASESVRSSDSEAGAPVPDLSLIDLARESGVSSDPQIRQRLMALRALVMVNDWNGQRAKAAMKAGSSSPLMSLGKLAMSGILHTAGSLQGSILGAGAMLGGESSPKAADATYSMLNAFFTSIGGGTDQIQRNIIGERILGLPKEPEVDKDVAFRDVRKA